MHLLGEEPTMKVGVVGAGMVGSSAAYAVVLLEAKSSLLTPMRNWLASQAMPRRQGVQLTTRCRSKSMRSCRAAYHIVEGKGTTYFDIGASLARVVQAFCNVEEAVVTPRDPTTRSQAFSCSPPGRRREPSSAPDRVASRAAQAVLSARRIKS